MKEWQKIGIACFIGGYIGTLVALSVAPQVWWLGVAAGFCAGYIGYEFKTVIKAASRAFSLALTDVTNVTIADIVCLVKNTTAAAFQWINNHPFGFIGLLMYSISCYEIFSLLINSNDIHWQNIIHIILGTLLLSCMTTGLLSLIINFFACVGASSKTYQNDGRTCWDFNDLFWVDISVSRRFDYNLPNFLKWFGRGIALTTWFFIWPVWKWLLQRIFLLAKGIYYGIYYAGKFLRLSIWYTVKFIHSDKRLLCGVDSAIGAGFTCFIFRDSPMLFAGFCGGLIGACWGVINYQLISIRLLKLKPAINKG